jgi:hypothetical protein
MTTQCSVFILYFCLHLKLKDFNDKTKKGEINGENAELGRVSKYIVHTVKP